MTETHLVWEDGAVPGVVHCWNKFEEHLGYLQYERVGAHMHWCWYQEQGIRMSPGCLEEVRTKQKELLREVNSKKRDINKKEKEEEKPKLVTYYDADDAAVDMLLATEEEERWINDVSIAEKRSRQQTRE